MASSYQRLNCSPTPQELLRIERFIKTREGSLSHILADIAMEEKEVSNCAKATRNLEASIPSCKKLLSLHEANLVSLMDIKRRLIELEAVRELRMEDEPHSRRLYESMRTSATAPIPRKLDRIEEDMEELRYLIRQLWDQVRSMEMELNGWRYSHRLSSAALEGLLTSKQHEESILKGAKESIRAIWRMPTEVWRMIFQMVIETELEDYLKWNNESPLRSTPLLLSQVCTTYRRIMEKTPELWRTITAHASTYWAQNKYELLAHSIAQSGPCVTLLSNISQTLSWFELDDYYCNVYNQGYESEHEANGEYQFQSTRGNSVQATAPDGVAALKGKSYELLLDMADDQLQFCQKIALVPFKNPVSLTFSSRNPLQYGAFFASLSSFPTAKSLTVINAYPQRVPSVDLASCLHQLKYLTLQTKELPLNFPLSGFLTFTLEELYLRNEGERSWPDLIASVQLPNLHTLGTNPSGTSLFEKVEMPAMKKLILYGSSQSSAAIVVSKTADLVYKRLRHLTFEDWKEAGGKDGVYGATSILDIMASTLSTVESLTFKNSFVDGQRLLSTVKSTHQVPNNGGLEKLEEITLSYTSGITRDQCDELKSLVKKLHVHI